VVDGLPGREVVGKEAPSAAAAHDVEESVEDLAQGVHPRASGSSGGGKMGLYAGPLGVGEIGLVCSSDHARHTTGLPLHNPFSDSFLEQLAV
jgi:hypothetical protein